MVNCAICGDEFLISIPSNELKKSSNAEQSTNETTYIKIKEITCANYTVPMAIKDGGKLRIKFDLATNSAGQSAYGRIYKNGVAVGTERTSTIETYTTYSEDIEFKANDKIQLYIKATSGFLAKIRNFRIYCDAICLSCCYDESLPIPRHVWN